MIAKEAEVCGDFVPAINFLSQKSLIDQIDLSDDRDLLRLSVQGVDEAIDPRGERERPFGKVEHPAPEIFNKIREEGDCPPDPRTDAEDDPNGDRKKEHD